MQRFEALEGQRREERQKTIEQKLSTGVNVDHFITPESCLIPITSGVVPEGLDEDDEKDNIGDNTIGQHFDAKNRQSVRNLRIREDTAKFLFNLDPNSAHYDPRTRAMRANPLQGEVSRGTSIAFESLLCFFHSLHSRTRNKRNSLEITLSVGRAMSSSFPRASCTRSLPKK